MSKEKITLIKDIKTNIKGKTLEEIYKYLDELEQNTLKKTKLRILLDMDSVLADDIGYAISLYNDKYGTNLNKEDVTDWNIDNFVPIPNTSILSFYHTGDFFIHLTPIKDSQKFVQKLIEDGHEIFVITASPKSGILEKMEWLRIYFPWIPVENFISSSQKYVVSGDVMLDDAYHNLKKANVTYPILMDAPWNKDNTLYNKVFSWEEFYEFIQSIVA